MRFVRARSPRLIGSVTDSNVLPRDTPQALHPCFHSSRWLWQLLTRQRASLQDGWTPLHGAASAGDEGAIGLLLAAGADRQAKNNVSGDRRGLVMRDM